MKNLFSLATVAILGSTAFAGSPVVSGGDSKKAVILPAPEEEPRLLFDVTSSYVFKSDFKRSNNAEGDALNNEIDLGYRIPLGIDWHPSDSLGNWYLRLGAHYDRFDFGHSGGFPLPNTLQSISAVIAVEYIVKGEVGFLFQTRPGYYFEQDISSSAFDSPITVGIAIPFSDNFYGIVGASVAFLRQYPIIPAVGFLWKPTSQWAIYAMIPEPRITYTPSENLALWAGGEINGGSFRVDRTNNRDTSGSINHTVVDYFEYRAGAGLTWTVKNCSVEVGGGYAFSRKFNYHRAEKGYETENGAPYIRAELRAAF